MYLFPFRNFLLLKNYIRKNEKIMGCLSVVVVADSDWCVIVSRCKTKNVTNFLVNFYRFVKGVHGVKSLHFIIRDRVGDDVIFSFRVLLETKEKQAAKSKIAYKLKSLVSEDKFAIDPTKDNQLFKYVAWSTERTAKIGEERFVLFCDFLSKMSKVVVEMAEHKYFGLGERVELAHVIAWMLGCTEYGLLTKECMEVGYYDRIEDKYCPYLKENFPK